MSKALRAWLLDWPAQPLALAQCEVIEVIEDPEVHRIPIDGGWCGAVVFWRDNLLPLALSHEQTLDGLAVVVVAYQKVSRAPLEHAAIAVRGMPRQFDVPADSDCEPPADCPLGQAQLRAFFRYQDRAIAVPELQNWFASAAVDA